MHIKKISNRSTDNAQDLDVIQIMQIKKISNTSTDNAENLDVVIPIYNLLEYNNNYSMA